MKTASTHALTMTREQIGSLARTPQGRIATPRAYEHLGLPAPDAPQPRLPEI